MLSLFFIVICKARRRAGLQPAISTDAMRPKPGFRKPGPRGLETAFPRPHTSANLFAPTDTRTDAIPTRYRRNTDVPHGALTKAQSC